MNIVNYVNGLIKKASGKAEDGGDYADVLDKINEINSSGRLPEKPRVEAGASYERLEYDAPSDEEINNAAENSLSEYRRAGEASVENEIAALIEKYSSDKSANSEAYARTIKSLEDAYASAVEAAGNDALKRGLARSSIAANTVAALNSEKAGKAASAAESYYLAERDLEEKLAGLEVKRQKAMDDFNISYTAKLTEEINRLKAQRDELMSEALKYNNSLTEKENEEKLERQKAESELYTEALGQAKAERELQDNLSAAEQDKKYQEIYGVLRDKLLTMSAQEAQNEIKNNSIYRAYLSDAYFYKLYDEFGR